MQRIAIAGLAAFVLSLIEPAEAQRAETILPARLIVQDDCPLTSPKATTGERGAVSEESAFAAALAAIAASFIGDLVSAGVTAFANALDAASQEHGFVAESKSDFEFFALKEPPKGEAPQLSRHQTCLVLYVPGAKGEVTEFATSQALKNLSEAGRAEGKNLNTFPANEDDPPAHAKDVADALVGLRRIGITKAPAVYVEAELFGRPDGMVVRPVLVWYREPLNGAPTRSTDVELQVSFATPGGPTAGSDIGSVFAVAEIKLPPMTPASAYRKDGDSAFLRGADDLLGVQSPVLTARPTTGSPDSTLNAYTAVQARVVTLTADQRAKRNAYAAAIRQLDAENKRSKPDEARRAQLTEAVAAAKQGLDDAEAALDAGQARQDKLNYGSASAPLRLGSTNVKMRFVVVRDANKFGQAFAKALKGQADAVGKAATDQLAPKPDWTAGDTAYLTAITNLNTKEREADALGASASPADIAKLQDEILVLKAKVNEAAVAAHRPAPYPDLYAQLK